MAIDFLLGLPCAVIVTILLIREGRKMTTCEDCAIMRDVEFQKEECEALHARNMELENKVMHLEATLQAMRIAASGCDGVCDGCDDKPCLGV